MWTASDTFRPVQHDLLSHKNVGTIYVAGDPSASTHIVFMLGFPCDQRSFLPLAEKIVQAEQDVFVGVSCLPEFDRVAQGWQPLQPQGYSFKEAGECFRQAVGAFKAEAKPKEGQTPKFFVVLHDWGTVPGIMYTNSHEGVDKLVLFDILPEMTAPGAHYCCKHRFYTRCFAIAFQLWKCCACLGFTFLLLAYVIIICPCIFPLSRKDVSVGGSITLSSIRAWHCWPYYRMHEITEAERTSDLSLKKALTRHPVLYIYGGDKATQWHNDEQLKMIEKAGNGSKWIDVPDGGHWLYKHVPDVCFKATREFLFPKTEVV